MLISSDLIDHSELNLYVREFRSLGNEFPPFGGGLGWDPELLSLDSVSHDAKIFASLLCDLLGSPGRCR
jgi:hypothetical protein